MEWNAPAVSESRKSHYFDAAARCVQLWLTKEVELCQPKLVISMGNEGCRVIHGRMNNADPDQNQPFTRLRGRLLRAGVTEGADDTRTDLFKNVNVFHCYHPSGLSLSNIDNHLNVDMKSGRRALVDLGLADVSRLNYAITPDDIAEIKGIIRAQN